MKETDIQRTLCDYLAFKMKMGQLMFWRQNNFTRFDVSSGKHFRLPKYSMRGIPDIIVVKDGRFIGLEVKQEKGRQSPEQKDFENLCQKHGGEYYLVTRLDDLINLGL